MKPIKLLPWAGAAVAAAGMVVMACPGLVARGWTDPRMLAGMPLHFDWRLLLEIATIVCGGLLIQLDTARQHP